MGFYNQVAPGSDVVRDVNLENDIRRTLGNFDVFRLPAKTEDYVLQPGIITGYNAADSGVTFEAGQPVEIGTAALAGDAVPFTSISKDWMTDGFAILLEPLDEGGFARAVVSGQTQTTLPSSGSGKFLTPRKLSSTSDTVWWKRGSSGARIVWESGTSAVALIGGNGGGDEYNGYFKLTDAGEKKIGIVDGGGHGKSYISVNGTIREYADYTSDALSEGGYYVYLEWDWDDSKLTQKILTETEKNNLKSDCMTARVFVGTAVVSADGVTVNQSGQTTGTWSVNSSYTGQFAVRWNAAGNDVIVMAGTADIGTVAETSLSFTSGNIYLVGEYDKTAKTWSLSYKNDDSYATKCSYQICSISGNTISQTWYDGKIYFSERFWI